MPEAVRRSLLTVLLCAILVACGGGGGGGPTTPTPQPPDRPEPPVGTPEPRPLPGAGEAFSGENILERKLSGTTLSGEMLVIDPTYDPNDNHPANHYNLVAKVMTDIGVPADNIGGYRDEGAIPGDESTYRHTPVFATINRDPSLPALSDLKVVVLPIFGAFAQHGVADAIGRHNVVFIAGAGNASVVGHDYYIAGHRDWMERDAQNGWPQGYSSFTETINALKTGKGLFAVWAGADANGNIVRDPVSVRCGDAQDGCIAVVLPKGQTHSTGTSFAAPVVGSAAYYLSQLWDRAEDVVGTMKSCAIDAGEPGVDEEFGVGALNLDCPTVAGREIRTASASVQTETRSPVLDSVTGSPGTVSVSPAGFAPDGGTVVPVMLLSERYRAFGLSLPLSGGKVTGVFGNGNAPLGVSSSFAPSSGPFFEIGMETDLLRSGNGSLSFVGTHGQSSDGMDSSATRLGLRHERKNGNSSFSLYGGALRVSAEVGIPGYAEASRPRVYLRDDSAEFKARYSLRF